MQEEDQGIIYPWRNVHRGEEHRLNVNIDEIRQYQNWENRPVLLELPYDMTMPVHCLDPYVETVVEAIGHLLLDHEDSRGDGDIYSMAGADDEWFLTLVKGKALDGRMQDRPNYRTKYCRCFVLGRDLDEAYTKLAQCHIWAVNDDKYTRIITERKNT